MEFSEGLPEIERVRIASSAIFKAGKRRLTEESVLREATLIQNKFLRKRPANFVVATGISAALFSIVKSLAGCRIRFAQTKPRQFDLRKIEPKIRDYVQSPLPTDYAFAAIETLGRSNEEAFEKAIAALDLLRGVWNLFLNFGTGPRYTNGRPRPVNRILLAPIHSLHRPNGRLVDENFWYDPGYMGPITRAVIHQPELQRLRKFEHYARKRLRVTKDREWLEDAIVRYCRALDEENFQLALLKLWTTLEVLTGTLPNDSYAVTIKRTSNFFKNPDFHSQVLETLRRQRNRLVHKSGSPYGIEQVVYRLKSYVESVLTICLQNRFRFRSRFELFEFLNLPSDRTALGRRRSLYEKALGLRK